MRVLAIAGSLFAACCLGVAEHPPPAGTTKFILDGNRMYAELAFVRPDGSLHRALAFVDMGSASLDLREPLFAELEVARGKPVTFRIGEMPIEVPPDLVRRDPSTPRSLGSELKVEALLPARVLQRFQVVIDYGARTLTLAHPGNIRPIGAPVPFRTKKETGLIAVDVSIDARHYSVTIDNGSAYTWLRQDVVRGWLASHPEWERGVGAVGASNMMMSGDGAEASGILIRVPRVSAGPLLLRNVGALAAGPGRSPEPNASLFDWYSTKNAVPVIGWIGGNVLKSFRLTIDYPDQTIYWERQAETETHELDQVGLTLRFEKGEYVVDAIARKNGLPTVQGVRPGDRLTRIGDLDTRGATWGAVFQAMHGEPGEARTLVLERAGTRVTVATRVTAF